MPCGTTTPQDFLGIGCEVLASARYSNYRAGSCQHSQVEEQDGIEQHHPIALSPDHTQYCTTVAALRSKTFIVPEVGVSASFAEKYIEPVMRFHQQVMLLPEAAKLSFTHSWLNNDQIFRLYAEGSRGKFLFCLVKFVSPDSFCWEGFARETIRCTRTIAFLKDWEEMIYAEETSPAFIVVTDEMQACVLSNNIQAADRHLYKFAISQIHPLSSGTMSLRHILNLVLSQMSLPRPDVRARETPVSGALNYERSFEQALALPSNPRGFLDFDRYTLERSLPDLEAFLAWKKQAEEEVMAASVTIGTRFRVDVQAFAQQVPQKYQFAETEDPAERLCRLNFPDEMMLREESAYARLEAYQGTMIPHSYGFHRFSFGTTFDAYGGLFEIIPGPTLAGVKLEEWNVGQQTALARHLRHCLRVLLYSGVDQGDFHPGQFIFPNGVAYEASHGLVLIDFAFAVQRLGDEQAMDVAAPPEMRGIQSLRRVLVACGIKEEISWQQFDYDARDIWEY
uniref:ABC1 atypical kinase-like domain-containing protein n=1 Tax=Mycena chlorophos TaxID=658473 RepID=A0ABQ0LYI1_MYCCL|nr:predicted protein [Mycena chlorophos]